MHRGGLLLYRNRYGDVVLVVMFNAVFPGWLAVQKQLSQAYTPIFRQIVWTGFHLQVPFIWPELYSILDCAVMF